MFLIAKHYKWNEDKMKNWFDQQETLIYDLGIEPRPGLDKIPGVSDSLPENLEKSGNFCLVCYEELTDDNKFALEGCRHTFCKDCWKDHLRATL